MQLDTFRDEIIECLKLKINEMQENQVDVFAIACNTLHTFSSEIEELDLDMQFLSIVESLKEFVQLQEIPQVCLLGSTLVTDLGKNGESPYQSIHDVTSVELLSSLQRREELDEIILGVKRFGSEPQIQPFIDFLGEIDSKYVVLACTEFSLIAQKAAEQGLFQSEGVEDLEDYPPNSAYYFNDGYTILIDATALNAYQITMTYLNGEYTSSDSSDDEDDESSISKSMEDRELATLSIWEDSVVGNDTIMNKLAEKHPYIQEYICKEDQFIRDPLFQLIGDSDSKDDEEDSLLYIDVGCGSGTSLLNLSDDIPLDFHDRVQLVGIDISSSSIEIATKLAKEKEVDGITTFLTWDSTKLSSLPNIQEMSNQSRKVVTCLGNTLGILRGQIQSETLREICSIIHEDDILLLTVWNADKFEFGRDTYYKDIQEISGPLPPECFHFDTFSVIEPNSDYYSHWWLEDELREILDTFGLDIVKSQKVSHCLMVQAMRKSNGD